MAREKITKIFSKNGIEITKHTNVYYNPCGDFSKNYLEYKTISSGSIKYAPIDEKDRPRWEEKMFESPLGFYYYKSVYTDTERIKKILEDTREFKHIYIIEFPSKKEKYTITYYTQYQGTNIVPGGTRPWDLMGNDFPDHFIEDLNKIVSDLILELKTSKKSLEITDRTCCMGNTLDDFKNSINVHLFGDRRGIVIGQTNEEKILSHGFDLKESFRGPSKI